jgi:hypothetical protein
VARLACGIRRGTAKIHFTQARFRRCQAKVSLESV